MDGPDVKLEASMEDGEPLIFGGDADPNVRNFFGEGHFLLREPSPVTVEEGETSEIVDDYQDEQEMGIMESMEQFFMRRERSPERRDENGDLIIGEFPCPLCQESFSVAENLRIHLTQHEEKPYKCSICKKYFKTETSLKTHLQNHINQKRFNCELCEKSFNQKRSLIQHVVTKHTDIKFTCTFCTMDFKTEMTMNVHLLRFHQDKDVRSLITTDIHDCPVCNKQFLQKKHLKQHLDTCASDEKRFPCTLCDKAFKSKISLTCHMCHHTGVWPYNCTVCEYKTAVLVEFRRHMCKHTGYRPFACPSCDYRAVRMTHLRDHIQSKH